MADRFVLCVCIPFAVETFDFLGGTIVAVSIKVNRDKGHACFRERVAFGKYGGLGAFLLWTQGLVLTTCIVFHVYSSADRISPECRTRLFLALNHWFALPPAQSAILQCLTAIGPLVDSRLFFWMAGVRTTMPFPSPALLFAIRT